MVYNCNICEENGILIFSLDDVPPQQNNYLSTKKEAQYFPKTSVVYIYCEKCLHVSIHKNKSIDFGVEYNNEIESSCVSTKHLNDVKKFIIDYLQDNNSFVVEVGCGRGQLLKLLHESKYHNIVGYDPCSEKDNQHKFVKNKLWGEDKCTNSIDLLILRHTLEELPNIKSFFEFINNKFIKNIYLEITSLNNILHESDIYSLYPEYYNIFSTESAINIFAKHGFALKLLNNYFNSSWHGMMFQKVNQNLNIDWEAINHSVSRFINKLQGTCVLWGAGGRGSDLLSFCKLDTSIISYVVELNSFKVGKFIPPFGQEIIDVEKLNRFKPSHIIISSSKFTDEIRSMVTFETNIISIQDIIRLST